MVAGAFLALSGFSLVLAEPKGRGVALRRLAVLAGAALAVTGGTFCLFPQDYIFFGILHCIVVCNALALLVLRAPVILLLIGAGCALALPHIAASSSLDGPAWWWLGLSKSLPTTLDYRPLLPWLGFVLIGVAAARLSPAPPRWTVSTPVSRGLAFAGRHSLALYLVHQPVLLGALTLARLIHPIPQVEAAGASLRECRDQCLATGAGAEGCEAGCACMQPSSDLRQWRSGPVSLHPPNPGLVGTACAEGERR